MQSGLKSVGPHQLRREIGTINEMFLGGDQHDCHELLTFLLDTLSEDLNRVRGKKAFQKVNTTIILFSSLFRYAATVWALSLQILLRTRM